MRTRRLRLALAAASAVALALLGGCGSGEEEPRPEPAPGAPNLIVITLDDATFEQVSPETMPIAFREIAERGTRFDDFIVPNPLCCPSRASFLTGQYGHNNGVLRNNYSQLRNKGNVLPRWLQLAGYRTFHVGKYLNGFQDALDEPEQVPWGWDEWYTLLNNQYYDYEISDNGEVLEFGTEPDDYATRVFNRKAHELVAEHAGGDDPFYLQLDHYAPHYVANPRTGHPEDRPCSGGATLDPDDRAAIEEPSRKDNPAINEADIADKPEFIRSLDPLSPRELRQKRHHYRCAVGSLRPVDRGIATLVEELEEAGVLDETAIFLTSDNGYFYGEHRIPAKKEFPYEENLRMPLLVRLPAGEGRQPVTVDAPVANIDLAPTILDLAGGEPCGDGERCRQLDGRSLLPLLADGGAANWPTDRAFILELVQSPSGDQDRVRPCSYIGVRQNHRVLVQHRTASREGEPCRPTRDAEVYDLRSDPAQLDNLAGRPAGAAIERELRGELQRLRGCSGNRADDEPSRRPCD